MQQRQWSGLAVSSKFARIRRFIVAIVQRQQLCSVAERTSHLFGESSEVCQSSLGVRKTGHVEDDDVVVECDDSLFIVNIEHRYPQMTHAMLISVFRDDRQIGKRFAASANSKSYTVRSFGNFRRQRM